MPPLTWYIYLSAAVFSLGLFGIMTRRNTIALLMSIELMLNAANINLVAFSGYLVNHTLVGQVFALFVIAVAAAEAAIGIAIVINLYRAVTHINADDVNLMKW